MCDFRGGAGGEKTLEAVLVSQLYQLIVNLLNEAAHFVGMHDHVHLFARSDSLSCEFDCFVKGETFIGHIYHLLSHGIVPRCRLRAYSARTLKTQSTRRYVPHAPPHGEAGELPADASGIADEKRRRFRVKKLAELPDLITPEQLCEVTGDLSVQAVRAACRRGDLPAAKIGRKWFIIKESLIGKEEEVA